MSEQETGQQSETKTTDFLDLEEQVVDAYTTGGAPKCRRVTRAIFNQIERILKHQKAELEASKGHNDTEKKAMTEAVHKLEDIIDRDPPAHDMVPYFEDLQSCLLSVVGQDQRQSEEDSDLKVGGTD